MRNNACIQRIVKHENKIQVVYQKEILKYFKLDNEIEYINEYKLIGEEKKVKPDNEI
jgi:hypothetical protein